MYSKQFSELLLEVITYLLTIVNVYNPHAPPLPINSYF